MIDIPDSTRQFLAACGNKEQSFNGRKGGKSGVIPVNTNFAKECKKERMHRGLSLNKLGVLVGVQSCTLYRFERGTHNLSVPKLKKLSEVLGVSL